MTNSVYIHYFQFARHIYQIELLQFLWKKGDPTAKEISCILTEHIGWSKATTYTVIKKGAPHHQLLVVGCSCNSTALTCTFRG